MTEGQWFKDLPVAITVCDARGTIIEMNEKSCRVFAKNGGSKLIGANLLDCHSEKSRQKIEEMFVTKTPNCYTIEKNGVKKMLYQTPWYKGGEFMGFVELIMEIPFELPNHIR